MDGSALSMWKDLHLKDTVLLRADCPEGDAVHFLHQPLLLSASCFFPHSTLEQGGAREIVTSVLIFQMKNLRPTEGSAVTLLVSEIR